MTKPSTQIKNIMESHLQRHMFGLDIWGQHEIATHDTFTLIHVQGPTRFERYGTIVVSHPELGQWICTIHTGSSQRDGAFLRGTPRLRMTTDEIKAAITTVRTSIAALYRVYAVPRPESTPVVWDMYQERKKRHDNT